MAVQQESGGVCSSCLRMDVRRRVDQSKLPTEEFLSPQIPPAVSTAPWTLQLRVEVFLPTEHPAAHIVKASLSSSATLSATFPADKGALATRCHVFLFVLVLPR